MGRNFVELRNFLERKFPELLGNISAETYPPPPAAEAFQTLAGWFQLFILAALFMGGQLFAMVGVREDHPVAKFVSENKMILFFASFMINNVAANMTKTGAFELVLDGEVIFSRIQSGRFPGGQELVRILTERGLKIS